MKRKFCCSFLLFVITLGPCLITGKKHQNPALSFKLYKRSNNGKNNQAKSLRHCSDVAPCKCKREKELICSKTDCIQQLPTDKLSVQDGKTIRSILVTRQFNLTTIDKIGLRALPNLRSIRLFNNRISTIHESAFYSNPDVELLDLHRNRFASFPSAIRQLLNLCSLDLSGNRIQYFPLGAFSSNSKLKSLYLRNNGITRVPTFLPKGLESLSLGLNRVFEVGDLRYLTSLKVLRLESNRLTTLNTAFLPLSLQKLRLSNNSLTSSSLSFAHLKDLRRLLLAENSQITRINRNTFAVSESSLVEVNLNACGIRTIDSEAFSCLPRLRVVQLRSNQLNYYDPEWFAYSHKIRQVGLSGNPWSCNCIFKQQLNDLTAEAGKQLEKLNRKLTSRTGNTTHFVFEQDFENITCSQVSSYLRRNKNRPSRTLTEISDCTDEVISWKFKPDICGAEDRSTIIKPSTTKTPKPITTSTSMLKSITTRSTTILTTTTTATSSTISNSTSKANNLDYERMCTKEGDECMFPFEYDGKTYTACAVHQGWTETYTWCYIDSNGSEGYYCTPC